MVVRWWTGGLCVVGLSRCGGSGRRERPRLGDSMVAEGNDVSDAL